MNAVVLTLAEHEAELEKCAVARFICRAGRVPSRGECAVELKMMEQEGVRPKPFELECANWLRERGVAIPGRDCNAARQMPSKAAPSAALVNATARASATPAAPVAVEVVPSADDMRFAEVAVGIRSREAYHNAAAKIAADRQIEADIRNAMSATQTIS
jgi:hypothetical protein